MFLVFGVFAVGFVDFRVDCLGFLPGKDAGSDPLIGKSSPAERR